MAVKAKKNDALALTAPMELFRAKPDPTTPTVPFKKDKKYADVSTSQRPKQVQDEKAKEKEMCSYEWQILKTQVFKRKA